MNSTEIETIIARKWNVRQHLIIPNVSWGLGVHECDLLIVSKSNYATEVEIKISKADLKKDAKKAHKHKSDKIKYLFFAVPEKLESCIDLIPEHAGVIIIREYKTKKQYDWQASHYADFVRQATPNSNCRKLTDAERLKLTELGCMRIWGLKNTIVSLKNDVADLRKQVKPKKKKHEKNMSESAVR